MTETDKNKYHNGKIYTIRSHMTDKYYIGSTCSPLHKRFYEHKTKFKYETSNNLNNYYSSFELLKYDDVYIELLEEFKCENKMELNKREGELIRHYKDVIVNMVIPNRDIKEYYSDNLDKYKKYYIDNKEKIIKYYQDNKERLIENRKEYRKNNKDKIRELIKCECGREITKNNFSTHKKSKLHNDLINKTIRI